MLAYLTIIFLLVSLLLRAKRGRRIKEDPQSVEKLVVWQFLGTKIHFHHAYLGMVILAGGWLSSSSSKLLMETGLALVISDILFHMIARFVWDDPLWD